MGMQGESITITKRNDLTTGVGTTVFNVDGNGAVAYAPTRLKQDSSVIHQSLVRCVDVISTAVDRAVFSPNNGVWKLAGVTYCNRVVGSDGSAVTADIMACDAGEAPASGVTQLTAADSINLKGTVDTPASVALAATLEEVGPGKYFAVNFGGTLTAVVSTITCEFQRIR